MPGAFEGAAEAVVLSRDEFHAIADFIRRRAGIVLCKRELAGRKLKPVASRFGFRRGSELVRELRAPSEALSREVIAALTTNETSFFRDRKVFEHLRRNTLPRLLHARREEQRIRIWCAASSTGQEAYSVAMLVDEFRVPLADWKVEILGTDISEPALARAREGHYSAAEIERGLTRELFQKHFEKDRDGWRIAKDMREAVTFTTRNLIEPFAYLGTFDVILCRNALIYFAPETKQQVLARLGAQLAPDGFLVLGAAETIAGFLTPFEPVSGVAGVYNQAPAAVRERKLAS